MAGTKYGVFQKGGIRYQRKPYLVAILDNLTQANLVASTITNAFVAALNDATIYTNDVVLGTAGVGGYTAGQIVYFDSGTSTYLPAIATAPTTARKIAGVSPIDVTAASSGEIIGSGITRVLADASCVPVIGAEIYLSRLAAGKCTTVLDGLTYPVQLGYCEDSAIGVDGMIAVRFAIDQSRDDSRCFTFVKTTLVAASASLSYPVTRTLWQELRLDADQIGIVAGAASTDISYPADIARATLVSAGDGNVSSYNSGTINYLRAYNYASGKNSRLTLTQRRLTSNMWEIRGDMTANRAAQGTLGHSTTIGYKTNPADALALTAAGGVLAFQIGSTVELCGKRLIP